MRDAADGRRSQPRRHHDLRRRARLRHRRHRGGLAHGREQCRWFGGMVGNHVADIVARYGDDAAGARRRSPTTSRAARATTTTSTARRATATRTFVPDEIVDRFCIVGPPEEHIERLRGAEGPRRRPVLDLPPARRQGPHPRRLRREGHARHRRPRASQGLMAGPARDACPTAPDRSGGRMIRSAPSRRDVRGGHAARRRALGGLQGDRPREGRRRARLRHPAADRTIR